VICNFISTAPWGVFPVGLVEPVELRGIRRGHVGPARGTGGTGAAGQARAAGVKIFLRGSTGPTDRFHQNQQNCLQYHRFHLAAPKCDGSLPRLKMSLSRPMGIL
jgi:hypothetical protein